MKISRGVVIAIEQRASHRDKEEKLWEIVDLPRKET